MLDSNVTEHLHSTCNTFNLHKMIRKIEQKEEKEKSASDQDASWKPPIGGFQGTTNCVETLGQAQNVLEGLCILLGSRWDNPGRAGKDVRNTILSLLPSQPNPTYSEDSMDG